MATCGISAGAEAVWEALRTEIARSGRNDVLLKRVGCIGQCHYEPLVEVAARGGMPFLYGNVTPKLAVEIFHNHLNDRPPLAAHLVDGAGASSWRCAGPLRPRTDHRSILQALMEALQAHGLRESVSLSEMGCPGQCQSSPTLVVYPGGAAYRLPTPQNACRVVEEHLLGGHPVEELLCAPMPCHRSCIRKTCPRWPMRQLRISSRNCGVIDPDSLDSALVTWAYQALSNALTTQTPEQVMQTVIDSGLRGRGGGGYPTGSEVARYAHLARRDEISHLQRR